MKRLRNDLRSPRLWRDLIGASLAAAGVFGIFISIAAAFAPDLLPAQKAWIWVVAGACLLFGVWRAWPRAIRQEYEAGYEIRVVVGDLFAQGNNVIVGMCDTFDVETPDIIHQGSVQGQMLDRIWRGDADQLSHDLLSALSGVSPVETVRKAGHQDRYPIGTVARLRRDGLDYICVAYSHMDHQNRATATLSGLTSALHATWEAVDVSGNGKPICCPLVGQGLSRLNVLTREASLRLIALTFALRSNQGRVASRLDIVLRQEDADRIDLREFQAFLRSLPGAIKRKP